MPFISELYSDSDVESDVSSEELVEDQHHYKRRRFGRQANHKDKTQSFDSEGSRECRITVVLS